MQQHRFTGSRPVPNECALETVRDSPPDDAKHGTAFVKGRSRRAHIFRGNIQR
jgi:hypothetical protein